MTQVFAHGDVPASPVCPDQDVANFRALVQIVTGELAVESAPAAVRDVYDHERSARVVLARCTRYWQHVRELRPAMRLFVELVQEPGRGIRMTLEHRQPDGQLRLRHSYPRSLEIWPSNPDLGLPQFILGILMGTAEALLHESLQ